MNTDILPEGSKLIREIDMKKDTKLSVWLNVVCLVIAVVMAAAGLLVRMAASGGEFVIGYANIGVLLAGFGGMIVYIVAHEAVHGLTMRAYGCRSVKFGLTGVFAYAGAPQYYFDRRSYCVVALAPVVCFGVLMAALCLLLPPEWFWAPYLVQICNISGSVGDMYVVLLASKMPSDLLVNDSGVGMKFYSSAPPSLTAADDTADSRE